MPIVTGVPSFMFFKTQIVAAAEERKLLCGLIKSQGLSSNLFLRHVNDAWTSYDNSESLIVQLSGL